LRSYRGKALWAAEIRSISRKSERSSLGLSERVARNENSFRDSICAGDRSVRGSASSELDRRQRFPANRQLRLHQDVRRSGLSVVKRSFPGLCSSTRSREMRKSQIAGESRKVIESDGYGRSASFDTKPEPTRRGCPHLRDGWQTSVERIVIRVPMERRKANHGSRTSSSTSLSR